MGRSIPIMVNRQILADVGRGIYRSPANALKELVSNAFDAKASNVWLTSNAPYFDTFTCEDDGKGMGPKDFEAVLGRIGSSEKREAEDEDGRPLIGRIGIGLLAVSQICSKFIVISKKRGDKTCFRTSIDLAQFEMPEPTDPEDDETGEPQAAAQDEEGEDDEDEFKLGDADMDDFLPVPKEEYKARYTKIIMTDIREGFLNELKDTTRQSYIMTTRRRGEEVSDFRQLVEHIAKGKTPVHKLSSYDIMLWELALLCPLEYIQGGPFGFPCTAAAKDARRLKEYGFKVYFDNLELRKPLLFPTSTDLRKAGDDYKVYKVPSFNKMEGGERLRFHGYLYSQRSKVRPPAMQGVLIRIKDVAIGEYDKTLRRYPGEHGPIFSMLSGEIFVEEGLEDALNIDRNSFNEIHAHYHALRAHLWKFVKSSVFNDMRIRSRNRNRRLRSRKAKQAMSEFCGSVKEATGVSIVPIRSERPRDEAFTYDDRRGRLTFHRNDWWASDRATREMQEKMVVAFVVAQRTSRTTAALRKTFFSLMSKERVR